MYFLCPLILLWASCKDHLCWSVDDLVLREGEAPDHVSPHHADLHPELGGEHHVEEEVDRAVADHQKLSKDCEHGVGGGVSKVSILWPEVLTGSDGLEVRHVGGDDDGLEDVTQDEDADNGQQGVHAVLRRPGDGHGLTVLTNTYLVMVRVVIMKRFVLSIISDQTQQLHIGEAYDEDRECNSQDISLNIQLSV